MTLYTASDIGFMAANVDGDENVEPVGTLDLVFRNCNQGQARFDADVIGIGEFRIKRISSIYHDRCSGGLSDDTPSDVKPTKLEVNLHSARDDISGKGEAEFWQGVGRSEFEVKAENIPDGSYLLEVCQTERGEMLVSNGEGKLEFKSPGEDDELFLNFDPRNCPIELRDVEGAFAGEIALTSGDAVLVAGNKVGDIEVLEEDGKTKGKLKFTKPLKAETLPLEFDPLGKEIEILQGETVILHALFPIE